jgi:hypothetical protein
MILIFTGWEFAEFCEVLVSASEVVVESVGDTEA